MLFRSLYADPPYTGSASYEGQYAVLDSILAGRDVRRPDSVFNAPDGLSALERLLVAARGRYRLIILSFGATRHSVDEVMGVVRGVLRPARRVPLRYKWRVGIQSDGTCLNADDKELLIVAEAP